MRRRLRPRMLVVFATAAVAPVGACARTDNATDAERLSTTKQALTSFNVVRRCYDDTNDCANLSETAITQQTVAAGSIANARMTVDSRIWASPLYAQNVSINGGTHNVVYVATMNDSLYAFDAESGVQYWYQHNSIVPSGYTVPWSYQVADKQGANCNQFINNNCATPGHVGISGTPVMDPVAGTIYFVAALYDGNSVSYWLHEVSMSTGADVIAPAHITANGFNPQYEQQRVALTLSSGNVYIGFGSFQDKSPPGSTWNGWLFGYSKFYSTLTHQWLWLNTGLFSSTPAQSPNMGGIWQSANGPAIDSSGYVYVSTGNGLYDGTSNYADAVVKLNPSTLTVAGSFAPYDLAGLNACDADLAIAPPTLFPSASGINKLVQGGKEARVYLLDPSKDFGGLGLNCSTCESTCSPSCLCTGGPCLPSTSTPPCPTGNLSNSQTLLWWNPAGTYRSPPGYYLYTWSWGGGVSLNQYPYETSSTTFQPSWDNTFSANGGWMSISSNGSTSGTGIIWAIGPNSNYSNDTLYAINAENLTQIWSTSVGTVSRWLPPVVANGEVYVVSPEADTSGWVQGYTFPCSSGAVVRDFFEPFMVGCGGQSTYPNAAHLCAASYHLCSSAEWNTNRGVRAPTADYWTSDNLNWYGNGSNHCEALTSGGNSCGTDPMRVCATSQPDAYGNKCNWVGCGLNTYTNEYFGGCSTNTYAGALCCRN